MKISRESDILKVFMDDTRMQLAKKSDEKTNDAIVD